MRAISCLLVVLSVSFAVAEEPPAEEIRKPRTLAGRELIESGVILPFSFAAQVPSTYVNISTLGGFDSLDGEGGRFKVALEGAAWRRGRRPRVGRLFQ